MRDSTLNTWLEHNLQRFWREELEGPNPISAKEWALDGLQGIEGHRASFVFDVETGKVLASSAKWSARPELVSELSASFKAELDLSSRMSELGDPIEDVVSFYGDEIKIQRATRSRRYVLVLWLRRQRGSVPAARLALESIAHGLDTIPQTNDAR